MQDYQEMMQNTFDNMVKIGAGGGGDIYKAHHKRLDIDVVLKKIHTKQLKNIDHRAELDILKKLKHNYIPQIFDFIEYGEDVYTVMEYIPGQSFAELLKDNKKFSQKDIVKWLAQLCEVVDYLHSQNPAIIHCDIKPANVMLTPDGNICLIDFNISGVKTEEGIDSIGYSHGYAPMEQLAVVARRIEKKRSAASFVSENVRAIGNEMLNDVTDIGTTEADTIDADTTKIDAIEIDVTEIDETEIECIESERKNEQSLARVVEPKRLPKLPSFSDSEWEQAMATISSVGKELIIDERTDIYSIGATIYHIWTGVRPQPFYQEHIPVQNIMKNTSESLAYVIEKAMAIRQEARFQSSGELLKTVRNLGTVDKRYKALKKKQWIVFVGMLICSVISAGVTSAGKIKMEEEKLIQYQNYISDMRESRELNNYELLKKAFIEATELQPESQDAYYQFAMSLFERKEYEECIVFLSENVYTNSIVSKERGYERFYYVTANCYFERNDYESAIKYYEQALYLRPEEVAYYRDYVVALARNGQIDEAQIALQIAMEKGISSEVISLLNGEIAVLKGEYDSGVGYLLKCITDTSDDYIKLRAYTKLDDAYQKLYAGESQYDIRIESLEEALEILPANYQITLIERLAQVYIDYSDVKEKDINCQKAIDIFQEMEKRGYATFLSRYNVAVLYEKKGEYSNAMEHLIKMLESYVDNYSIYKRMSFVELSIQAEKPNIARNYVKFAEYYEKAMELYQENANTEDVEMLSLQQLYRDVVDNGWL